MLNKYISKLKYISKEEGLLILLRRIVRFISYKFLRIFLSNQKDIKEWQELKGKYSGERAFIIGNGPSLNKTPLHLLKDEYTFCFNRFDLMLERLQWEPFAYSVIDDLVLSDVPDIINAMAKRSKYAFFPDIHPSAPIGFNYKKLINNRENIYWLHLGEIGFSNKLPNCGINKTVANVAVQILVYMGFSEINFVGVDLDYKIPKSVIKDNQRELEGGSDDDPNHFDPRYFGKGRKFHHPRMEETFEKFDEAALFLERHNVKGYNVGIGGKLESFERKSFRSLFGYTQEEEFELMLGHIIQEFNTFNFRDNFPKALVISSIDDWDDTKDEIIAEENLGVQLIPKKIISYLPIGPYEGEYLFLKKGKYLSE